MAIEKNLATRSISAQNTDNVSVSIFQHLIKPGILKNFFEKSHDIPLFARIAPTLHEALNARDDLLFALFA